jgi:hypothetical protein
MYSQCKSLVSSRYETWRYSGFYKVEISISEDERFSVFQRLALEVGAYGTVRGNAILKVGPTVPYEASTLHVRAYMHSIVQCSYDTIHTYSEPCSSGEYEEDNVLVWAIVSSPCYSAGSLTVSNAGVIARIRKQ